MKRIIEIPMAGGGSVAVEVDEATTPVGPAAPAAPAPGGGVVRRGLLPTEKAPAVLQDFEAGLERVRPAAAAIIAKLREMADRPEEIEISFGLKLSAEAGVFIASASTEANFDVRMKWSSKPKE